MNRAMPLFDSGAPSIPMKETERRILGIVEQYRGAVNPVSIETIRRITGLTERSIKGAVSELVITHRVLIGANRQSPVGYFMIESEADREAANAPLEAQVIQMLRRLRVINGKRRVREWLGQLALQEDQQG